MEHAERRQKMKHFSFVAHICLSWAQKTIIMHLEHLKAPQGWKPRLGQYLLTCVSCRSVPNLGAPPFPLLCEKMLIMLFSEGKTRGKCTRGDPDTKMKIAMYTSISLYCFYREYKIFKVKSLIILLLRFNPWEPQEVTKYAFNIKEWKILEGKVAQCQR